MPNLERPIEVLCPDLSNSEVRRASDILRGQPLLQASELPKADYGFPMIGIGDERMSSLKIVAEEMSNRMRSGGFCGLALTQVGGTYPLAVVDTDIGVAGYQQLNCELIGNEVVTTTEGCGSLKMSFFDRRNTSDLLPQYFPRLPAQAIISYGDLSGSPNRHKYSLGGNTSLTEREVAHKLIHEERHLKGNTALNWGILDLREALNFAPENFLGFELLSQFHPFGKTGEETPRDILISYFRWLESRGTPHFFLLPDRSEVRLVSVGELAKEIEKI